MLERRFRHKSTVSLPSTAQPCFHFGRNLSFLRMRKLRLGWGLCCRLIAGAQLLQSGSFRARYCLSSCPQLVSWRLPRLKASDLWSEHVLWVAFKLQSCVCAQPSWGLTWHLLRFRLRNGKHWDKIRLWNRWQRGPWIWPADLFCLPPPTTKWYTLITSVNNKKHYCQHVMIRRSCIKVQIPTFFFFFFAKSKNVSPWFLTGTC